MTLVSCAIVGYGRIGRLCHEIIQANPALGLRVVAIADLEAVDAATDSAILTRDYRELLRPGIDAFLIATPPAVHFEIASHVVASGKHVWLEKPPCRTLPECRELIASSQHRPSILFYAWHAMYSKSVKLARESLNGAIVSSINAQYFENVLNFHRPDSWVHAEGVLRDSGVNALSIMTRLIPYGQRLQLTEAAVTAQRASARFHFGVSSIATLQTDWNHTGEEIRTITVNSNRGQFVIDIGRNTLCRDGSLLFGDSDARNSLHSEYQLMLQDFQACIAAGTSKCDCEEMRLLDDIDGMAGRRG